MQHASYFFSLFLGVGFVALAEPPIALKPNTVVTETSQDQMGIDLLGTILQKNEADNVILIKQLSNKKVDAFRIGFKILDKYWITKIAKDFIEVSENKDSQAVLTRIYSDAFDLKIAAKPTLEPKIATGSLPSTFEEEGFKRDNNNVALTEDYRKKIKEDLPKILMQASAEPAMKDGVIIGFSIDQIEENSIFQKIGLINGDIVTSINGRNLSDVTAAIAILQSLKDANSVSFEVTRGDQALQFKGEVH